MTGDELKGQSEQCNRQFRAAMEEHAAQQTQCDGNGALSRSLLAIHDQVAAQSEFLSNGLTRKIGDDVRQFLEELREDLRKGLEGVAPAQRSASPLTFNGKAIPWPSGATVWRAGILAAVLVTSVINGCETSRLGGKAMPVLDPKDVALVRDLARELAGLSTGATAGRPPLRY